MKTPSTPAGSLADFVDWYTKTINPIPQPNIPQQNPSVIFVSHSGTLKKFVDQVKTLSPSPSPDFNTAYKEAAGTNTWSLVFKTADGTTFKGFRHAYSCDNRLKDRGGVNIFFERYAVGDYTNLALWGIISTLKFNETAQRLIRMPTFTYAPGLKLCKGMKKELPEYHGTNFDSVNVLCGKQRNRMATNKFSIASGYCGTSSTSSVFNVTLNNDCIRIITDPNGPKVVLYLDKKKKVVEARFFQSVSSQKYIPTGDNPTTLNPSNIANTLKLIVNTLQPSINNDDPLIMDGLVNDLINAVDSFVINNPSYTSSWKTAFTSLGLPQQEPAPVQLQSQPSMQSQSQRLPAAVPVRGGTTKKSRRHRKNYTRKNQKYSSTRKSRQVHRRRRTHGGMNTCNA